MSLEIIPYQPLPFNLEENCTLPCANWIQKIQNSDATSVQFINTPCVTADTILSNGNFASGGTDWTTNGSWTFGSFTATSPISTSGFIEQTVTIGADGYYEISFAATVNNGTLVVSSTTATLIGYVTSSGIYTFTVFLEVGDTINFFFNQALGGNISNIACKPIDTRVRLDVLGLDNSFVATVPSSSFTFNQGFLTANIDWDGLSLNDGCYKLAVYDPCECSQFGFAGDDFEVPNQFIVTEGTANITGGVMTFTSTGNVEVRSRALLCNSTEYTVTYRLAGMNPSDEFRLNLGGAVGTLRTADGNYTETITTTISGTPQVRFLAVNNVALSSFNVSNFSIEATTPVIAYESVNFDLRETHPCSVLIEACGIGEEFNFGFVATGFKPVIRLEGTYRTANYPSTRTEYEYSTGEKVVPYMRTRRAKTLLFGAPEYVHDFARLWLGISNLYVNGELSASEDSEPPTISWEEDVDLGLATFTFSKKTELTEKRSCTTLPNIGCDVNGFTLQIERTGGYTINPSILATAQGIEIQFGN